MVPVQDSFGERVAMAGYTSTVGKDLTRLARDHWFPVAVLAIATALALYVAGTKPLWTDEIQTLLIARSPTIGAVWQGLATGPQSDPPLFYVAARGSMSLFGDNPLAFRLPSVIGVVVMCLAVYVFVARRYPVAYARLAL